MTREEQEAHVRSQERRCRGALSAEDRAIVNQLMIDDNMEAAKLHDAHNRKGCGADFSDVVCAGPFDGELHAYVCPQCGVEGAYIAPKFED